MKLFVAAVALALTLQLPTPSSITVSAAVSLTDALTSVAEVYSDNGHGGVRFNFAASNLLAQQIVAGTAPDVFISADEAQMEVVAHAGLVMPGTRVDLMDNQLAVVVPAGHPRTFTSIGDLRDPALKRIAIGDPAGVPVGVYAKQYLEQVGLWPDLQSRMVPFESVRAVLAAAEAGAVDAAIVYRTDGRMASRATVAWVVPAAQGPHIVYPAAVIVGTHEPDAAKRFLDFMQGSAAWNVLERFGFSKPH